MQVTVQGVSKTGNGINTGTKGPDGKDIWLTASKFDNVSFSQLKKGDFIEVVENKGFVKSFYFVVPESSVPPATIALQPLALPNNKEAKIMLGNAFNAAFSAVYTAVVTEASHEEAFTVAVSACKEIAKIISEAV